MAPLLADVSQGQALRLYQVECLARRSRATVERSLLRGLRASALRPGPRIANSVKSPAQNVSGIVVIAR
jgi:hypothetical protein